MINSKQKVKIICDALMQVAPFQIVIDFVQDDVEESIYSESVTPDDIGSLAYMCSNLIDVYNPEFEEDILFLIALRGALNEWLSDAEFANKSLGLDPNK